MPARPSDRRRMRVAALGVVPLLLLGACGTAEEQPEEEQGPLVTSLASAPVPSSVRQYTSDVDFDFDACALTGYTVSEVAEITGIPLDPADEVGVADVSNQCVWGVPDEEPTTSPTTSPVPTNGAGATPTTTAPTATGTTTGSGPTSTVTVTTTQTPANRHPDGQSAEAAAADAPNLVAAGVVEPSGDTDTALALQLVQLAPSYECSEVLPPESLAPEAPTTTFPAAPGTGESVDADATGADVDDDGAADDGTTDETAGTGTDTGTGTGTGTELLPLPYSHIECSRPVTGGGTQVDLIVGVGELIWQLSASLPSQARTEESIELATFGLRQLAAQLPEVAAE